MGPRGLMTRAGGSHSCWRMVLENLERHTITAAERAKASQQPRQEPCTVRGALGTRSGPQLASILAKQASQVRAHTS